MELNKYIDHTNLKAYAREEDIIKLCNEAIKYNFQSVVVNPHYITLAKECLKDTNVGVTTVVGFPLGVNTLETKVYETVDAIEKGADEIDMVINIGALKDKDYEYVKREIQDVFYSADGKCVKVIIETCYLTEEEITEAVKICNECFVNYIKTSTGFDKEGAKLSDVNLIMKHKNEVLEVKASGGIRNAKDAEAFIEAGATRLGTSHGIDIIKGDE